MQALHVKYRCVGVPPSFNWLLCPPKTALKMLRYNYVYIYRTLPRLRPPLLHATKQLQVGWA